MRKKKIAVGVAAIMVSILFVVATVGATVYDFKDTVNNTAYEGYDANKPAGVPPDNETELSSANYQAVNSSDDIRASYSKPIQPSGQYDFHRFKFKITESIPDIMQLYVMHEGYGTTNGTGLQLYIWNYTALNWESVNYNYASSDATIDETYTSGFSNYINASGYLELLAITYYNAISCPFYYSYTGSDYILDGEGLLFSPLPWWERSSMVMLENLKPVNGSYKLKVTEELTETSYFDRLSLLVAEHSPEVTVYPDFYGNLHTIKNPIMPVSCTDNEGNDCLALMEKDDIYWLPQPDFEKLQDTDNDGIIDSYNESDFYKEIVLEYPRSENVTHAKLLYRLKEQRFGTVGIWGGVLHTLGRNNLDKLRDPYGDQVLEWVLSQMMTLEIWNGTDWVVLHRTADATASTKGNNMVFSLNLTDRDTDTVKIKFKSLVGVQGVDYVLIDYSEDKGIEVTQIIPSSVTGGEEEKILNDDSEYLILESGDCIYITFPELPTTENRSRTYLISDNGYYLDNYNNVVNYTEEVEELLNQIFHDEIFASRYFIPEFFSEHYSGHHTIYTDYVSVETKSAALEVNKTVWDPVNETWVKELNASIGDTLRFKCTMHNSGEVNLTQLRFWDILDCSLVFAGNATLTNASGVKEEIPTPPCPPSYCFKPQVLHPYNLSWDPYNPCLWEENFSELCPDTGHNHTLDQWEDNGDDRISACDQIWLESYCEWYHVENVPYTLLVNNTETGESMYIESVLDYESVTLSEPNSTEWLKVCGCKDRYTLIDWQDIANNFAQLSVGDQVTMRNERTEEEVQYTIEEVTIDLVVSKEWQIDWLPFDPYVPRILEPSQSITIEYNATVVKCGVDNNTFVAKGSYGCQWHYSEPDVVTITVPCPSANATDSAGAPWEIYYVDETVYATGCGFKPNSLVNIYVTEDKLWLYGMDINSTIYKRAENVSTNASGCVFGYLLWPNPDPGTYDLAIDANRDGKLDLGDGIDGLEGPGFMVLERALSRVPALTPIGLIALVGLLSAIAAVTVVRKRR